MNKAQAIALSTCSAAALIIGALLAMCTLTAVAPAKQRQATELLPIEEDVEEYVDFISEEPQNSTPEAAYSPQAESHNSQAAERTTPTEPTPQQLQARAREEATRDIANAFKSDKDALDNTENKTKDNANGDTGQPDNNLSAVNGSGDGSVGGGWIMPRYAKVRSTLTGRIELRATINAEGKVTHVEQTGGKAPAGTDAALIKRCIAEVRSRRFTRNDDAPPSSATARIIYTFQ